MIQGTFGSRGELFFEIDLIAADGLNLTVEAMLDTGFTEFLAINKQDLDGLDWQFIRQNEMITAQGESTFDVYAGKILLGEQEFDIPVFEVRPGIIKTDMTEKVSQKYDDLIENGLCLTKRWGLPEDVGKTVTAIAQGNFVYSTGQVFVVDGGLTVARL